MKLLDYRYVHVKIFFSKIELLPAADESIHCFTSFGQTCLLSDVLISPLSTLLYGKLYLMTLISIFPNICKIQHTFICYGHFNFLFSEMHISLYQYHTVLTIIAINYNLIGQVCPLYFSSFGYYWFSSRLYNFRISLSNSTLTLLSL